VFTTSDGRLLPNTVFRLRNPFGKAEEFTVQAGTDSDLSTKGLQQMLLNPLSSTTFNVRAFIP
jgi:hypothetical protein